MKKTLGLLTAMAMMAYGSNNNENIIKPKEESEEEKKLRLKQIENDQHKANGLTEFFYGENSVWALNQKTADKKAKKKGYL